MSKKTVQITRRAFVASSAAAIMSLTAGSAVGAGKSIVSLRSGSSRKGRSIRFAHFTDIHLMPKRGAPEGLTAALHHVQSLKDRPEMIITGGDNIMDSLGADDNWTAVQYQTLKEIFAKECKLPVKFCVGNHDVWGWDKESSKTTGQEELWGKKRVVKELDLPNRYYGFDRGKWHFILLDSTYPDPDDSTYPDDSIYTALLDEEQFNWFAQELESYKKSHICIISHIPILSVAAFLDGDNEKTGRWTLPDEWMHLDARKIKDLLAKYPNVRLCISGHLHLVDRAQYNGMTYICDGAVCGAWWRGKNYECDAGYGVFDLFDDGTFEHQYISYGWIPKKESD